LPGDELIPDFLSSSPFGIWSNTPEAGLTMGQGPSTPAIDLFDMLGQPKSSGFQQLTPAIQVPFTLLSGKDVGRGGVPVTGLGAQAKYVAGQTPGINFGTQVATSKQPAAFNFLNWLTGAGIMTTKPYENTAYYDQLDKWKKSGG
jgi:hypothetical protein